MKIVIITGLSGAGKSNALRYFEDCGYYCIDNMPPELLQSVAQFIVNADKVVSKIAVAIDIRSGELYSKLSQSVMSLRASEADVRVIFIDADDDALVKRYKETRRRHPLDEEASGSLYKAIELERRATLGAKEIADYYIDTTYTSTSDFRQRLTELFHDEDGEMIINVVSFGFKYGVPKDADLVFDVRCLPNPFYVPELKNKTGLDDDVYNYVMNCNEANEVFAKLSDLIEYLLPLYVKEGKTRLVIAFGCTGGKHRSVSFARRMSELLESKGANIRVEHRHINL